MQPFACFVVFLSVALASSSAAGSKWAFHCEAEKGALTASVGADPTPLDTQLFTIPAYSPDPLGDAASVQRSQTRVPPTRARGLRGGRWVRFGA